MSKKRKRRRATRTARERPERAQDPRLVATLVTGPVGIEGVRPGDWMVAVSPVRLPDGRVLAYHPPQPVAFNLIEAKRHRDRGASQRRAILGNLRASKDGNYRPHNSHAAVDCLSDLVGAVLHAFTAIESFANHSIDQPDDDATVTVERQGEEVAIAKEAMVRRLAITEKLELAVPLLPDGNPTKGTAAWGHFVHLKRLRDDLVHVKERGFSSDPDKPAAYGQLMLGAGDECVEEAVALVQAARPIFLPDHVLKALEAAPPPPARAGASGGRPAHAGPCPSCGSPRSRRRRPANAL